MGITWWFGLFDFVMLFSYLLHFSILYHNKWNKIEFEFLQQYGKVQNLNQINTYWKTKK